MSVHVLLLPYHDVSTRSPALTQSAGRPITLLHRHHTSSAVHLVFPLLHHVFAAHMRRLGQVLLRHRSAFDIRAQTPAHCLNSSGFFAPAGIPAVGLDAHGV